MSLFNCFKPIDQTYTTFLNSDNTYVQQAKIELEMMWGKCAQYLDPDFQNKLGRDFLACLWELRLCSEFLSLELELIPTEGRGPDFCIRNNGQKIWVEAVCPKKGEGQFKVPDIDFDEAQWLPSDLLKARYINSIQKKYQKSFIKWLKAGLINTKDSFIVALNHSCLEHPDSDDGELPLIVKALYGIGSYQAVIRVPDGKLLRCEHERVCKIVPSGNKEINSQLFKVPDFKDISGVIYSRHSPITIESHLYNEKYCIYIENALASNPVNLELFKSWKSYSFNGTSPIIIGKEF